MKLKEFNPGIDSKGFLRFNCPGCEKIGSGHSIRIPIFPTKDDRNQSWKPKREFPDNYTLEPSINSGCGLFHANIINGEIIFP